MFTRLLSIGLGAALVGCALHTSGCAPCQKDRSGNGTVGIVTTPSKRVDIYQTSAYRHGTHTVISGHVRGARRAAFPAHGHVDAHVLSPDGDVVAEAHTSDIYVPRYRRGQSASARRFYAHLPIHPPAGSTVSVAFHSRSHEHCSPSARPGQSTPAPPVQAQPRHPPAPAP